MPWREKVGFIPTNSRNNTCNGISDCKNINYSLGGVKLGHNKKVYCFDFKNLLNKTKLVNDDDKDRFIPLKRSIAYRAVAYQDVSIYYFIQEVYKKL